MTDARIAHSRAAGRGGGDATSPDRSRFTSRKAATWERRRQDAAGASAPIAQSAGRGRRTPTPTPKGDRAAGAALRVRPARSAPRPGACAAEACSVRRSRAATPRPAARPSRSGHSHTGAGEVRAQTGLYISGPPGRGDCALGRSRVVHLSVRRGGLGRHRQPPVARATHKDGPRSGRERHKARLALWTVAPV